MGSSRSSAQPELPAVASLTQPATLEAADVRRTVVTVAIGEILVQLGLTPVTAVIPSLAAALGVGAADGAWILTVFILALAGALLVAERLGDLLGHRRVFGLGAAVYTVATIGAGLAPSFGVLLVARAAQGIGAAMVSGNNLAILTRAVPEAHRGRAIATVATASSFMAVVGAGLGTAAVALGGWQVLFLGVVPLAVLAVIRARQLPGSDPARVSVDWTGAGLLVLTISFLAIALNHPHTATGEVVMPVFHLWLPLLAVIAAAAFLLVERRVRVPLLDWAQLRDRAFAAAIAVNAILHVTMMAGLYLGPVLAVRGLGLDTTAGGMLMVVVQSSLVLTAFMGGWLYDRTRSPWLRPGAAAILAIGLVAWAIVGVNGSYAGLLAAGLFAGLGSGVLLSVNNTVIMGLLPANARGVASGMLETSRHFGHAFGVTIPNAVLALVAASAGPPADEAAVLRAGFFWACLAMAALAGLSVALATVGPPSGPRRRRHGEPELALSFQP